MKTWVTHEVSIKIRHSHNYFLSKSKPLDRPVTGFNTRVFALVLLNFSVKEQFFNAF